MSKYIINTSNYTSNRVESKTAILNAKKGNKYSMLLWFLVASISVYFLAGILGSLSFYLI